MADNVNVTAGVGTAIAADDVGSVFFQKVKLDLGTDGVSAPALAGAGVVATGVQRITLASDDPAVALLTTIDSDTSKITACNTGAVVVASGAITETNSGSIKTAVELLDNAVDGNYLNTNLNIAGTDVSANAGVLTAQTQRVTIATDDEVNNLLGTIDTDTGVIAGDTTSIDAKITACNTGAVVLSSGTVTTVSTVTNLAQMGGAALNMGEGVISTGTQRVTLATDDDGVAHLSTIAGDTTSMDGKITACNTGAVVLAAGSAAIGKLAANSGVDIGDVDILSIAAGDNNIGNVDIVTVPAPLNVVGGGTEAAALRVTIANDSTGVVTVDGTVTAELSATDNAVLDSIVTNTDRSAITGYGQAKLDHADVSSAQVLVAAVADKKFYITSIVLSVAAAGSYWIEDDDAAQITCKYTLAANGGLAISFPIDTPYKSTTANKGLKVKGSAAGVIGCMITYYTLA